MYFLLKYLILKPKDLYFIINHCFIFKICMGHPVGTNKCILRMRLLTYHNFGPIRQTSKAMNSWGRYVGLNAHVNLVSLLYLCRISPIFYIALIRPSPPPLTFIHSVILSFCQKLDKVHHHESSYPSELHSIHSAARWTVYLYLLFWCFLFRTFLHRYEVNVGITSHVGTP